MRILGVSLFSNRSGEQVQTVRHEQVQMPVRIVKIERTSMGYNFSISYESYEDNATVIRQIAELRERIEAEIGAENLATRPIK